jgi:hypothetical protein
MRYIEVFYNRWRPYTNNEGLPPATAMANFTTETRRFPLLPNQKETTRLSHILDTPQSQDGVTG